MHTALYWNPFGTVERVDAFDTVEKSMHQLVTRCQLLVDAPRTFSRVLLYTAYDDVLYDEPDELVECVM